MVELEALLACVEQERAVERCHTRQRLDHHTRRRHNGLPGHKGSAGNVRGQRLRCVDVVRRESRQRDDDRRGVDASEVGIDEGRPHNGTPATVLGPMRRI